MSDAKQLSVTLVKGLMGKNKSHRATVRALGLKWRSHTVHVNDTPVVRGMIAKVSYMLRVDEGQPPSAAAQ